MCVCWLFYECMRICVFDSVDRYIIYFCVYTMCVYVHTSIN